MSTIRAFDSIGQNAIIHVHFSRSHTMFYNFLNIQTLSRFIHEHVGVDKFNMCT